jgi:hypothetical protein
MRSSKTSRRSLGCPGMVGTRGARARVSVPAKISGKEERIELLELIHGGGLDFIDDGGRRPSSGASEWRRWIERLQELHRAACWPRKKKTEAVNCFGPVLVMGWADPWIGAGLRAGKSFPIFFLLQFLFFLLYFLCCLSNLNLLFCFAGLNLLFICRILSLKLLFKHEYDTSYPKHNIKQILHVYLHIKW